MRLDPVQLEMNQEVVKFLLEHGADKYLKSKTNGMNAIELAENHCAKDNVKRLLSSTK